MSRLQRFKNSGPSPGALPQENRDIVYSKSDPVVAAHGGLALAVKRIESGSDIHTLAQQLREAAK
jgi:hypothetical protein